MTFVIICLVIVTGWNFFKKVILPIETYKAARKYNRSQNESFYDPCNNRL